MSVFITTQTLDREEAMRRINLLAGKDLRLLADEYGIPVWKNGHENKGWAGLVIERYLGLPQNSRQAPDFGTLMGQFLDSLPDGGLVMCHPGFVDDVLVSLDPLTTQREHEHKYLASEDFPRLLAANKVTLG